MLELLAYVFGLLVLMPALLLGVCKLIPVYKGTPSASRVTVRNPAGPTPQNYETLHQRLVAAAEAHPFLPKPFFRSKRTQT